jgi:hypothetical protein
VKPTLTPPPQRRRAQAGVRSYRSRLAIGVAFAFLGAAAVFVTAFLPQRTAHVPVPSGATEPPRPPGARIERPAAPGVGSARPTPAEPAMPTGQPTTAARDAPETPTRQRADAASPPGASPSGAPRPESRRDRAAAVAEPARSAARPDASRTSERDGRVVRRSDDAQPAASAPAEGGSHGSEPSAAREVPPPAPPSTEYERAIAAAFDALARNDGVSARQSLDAARRVRPDAPEVRTLTQRIQEGSQREELERIRRTAADHENGERWALAVQEYEQALRIDKDATFAVRGKTRAERTLAIQEQLDFYVAQPDRLQSSGPLAHANEVLAAAAANPNGGARLRASRERVQALVDRASRPRAVTIRSDETTEVTVHKVGRLGRFREQSLTLPPGEYTAVGSRVGYRDARIRFRVSPDDQETVVEVRCEERI